MEEGINFVYYGGLEIRFSVPNALTASRVLSFWFKEPDTLDWIKTFQPEDLFIDIGANMGLYSLFAACAQKVRVLAFEPEGLNYALLNRNIFLNDMAHRIQAYPLALSDEASLNSLHLSHFLEGGSCNNFKEKLNYKHERLDSAFSQGCFSITLDDLVEKYSVPIPQHIKIDVDGIEHKILQGAIRTLDNPQLRSVLVELNTNLSIHREVIDFMGKKGFSYSENQVEGYLIRQGPFEGIGNYIFFRD